MSRKTLRRVSSAIRLKRDRRGLTLLETILVLAIGSMLIYGLMLLVVQTQEQIWISMQVRDASEWGNDYVDFFTRIVRNSVQVTIRQQTPPSQLVAIYENPYEIPLQTKEYLFSYDIRRSAPTIRINGVMQNDLSYFDPYHLTQRDSRDRVQVVRTGFDQGFIIYHPESDRSDTPAKFKDTVALAEDSDANTEVYVTIDFWVRYTRYPGSRGTERGTYTKDMHFTGSAYVLNPNWPMDNSGYFSTVEEEDLP